MRGYSHLGISHIMVRGLFNGAVRSRKKQEKAKYLVEEKDVAMMGRRSEALIGDRECASDVRDGMEEGFTRIYTALIRSCRHRLESFHHLGGPA